MSLTFALGISRVFTRSSFSNIALNTASQINCQSLYVFNQFMGNTAIATASTLLMLRTIAIWSRNIYIVVPLVILSLGRKLNRTSLEALANPLQQNGLSFCTE